MSGLSVTDTQIFPAWEEKKNDCQYKALFLFLDTCLNTHSCRCAHKNAYTTIGLPRSFKRMTKTHTSTLISFRTLRCQNRKTVTGLKNADGLQTWESVRDSFGSEWSLAVLGKYCVLLSFFKLYTVHASLCFRSSLSVTFGCEKVTMDCITSSYYCKFDIKKIHSYVKKI